MESRRNLNSFVNYFFHSKFFILFIFFILFRLPIFTQDEGAVFSSSKMKKSFFINEGDAGNEFIQHLSWDAVNDILSFEFILEQFSKDGSWKVFLTKRLVENTIHLSLKPGKYRFKVAVINLLGQHEKESDYREFNILIAYQPEVASITPRIINFDDEDNNSITITGKNLFEETSYSLITPTKSVINLTPDTVEQNGTKVKFNLNFNKIPVGTHTVLVEDVSGLKDDTHTMTFRFQKPVDFYISGGYVFSGFAGNQVFREYLNKDFLAAGGILRFSVQPIKRVYGTFGVNLSLSGSYMKSQFDEYSFQMGALFTQFNFSYIVPLIKSRLNFDFHAGLAMLGLLNVRFVDSSGFKSEPAYFWKFAPEFGTALHVFLYKGLYLEINMDHLFFPSKDVPTYIVQPSLSIGVKL